MSDDCNSNSPKRPRLIELTVSYLKVNNNNNKIEVKYIIDPESIESIPNLFSFDPINISFDKLEDYENFLMIFDFSSILILNFHINGNTEVIRLFNKYNNSPNSFFSLTIDDSGDSNENNGEDIFNLINNIKNCNEIYLSLNISHQQVPKNFIFPVMKSLKVITIKELNDTRFLNIKIISHLIETCPELRSIKILATNKAIYYEIMKMLFEKEALSLSSGCKNKCFDAQFGMDRNLSPVTVFFYKSLFEDKNFEVSTLCFTIDKDKLGYSFYGFKKCYTCNGEHIVNVLFEIGS